jgi:GNAT superfamily N-acetyltransferase
VRISNAPEYSLPERMAVLGDYTLPALQRRLGRAELFLVASMAGSDRGPQAAASAAQANHPQSERTLLIDTMFVDPDVQGMGMGGALLDDIAQRARRLDYRMLSVAASLTAVAFYAHMGFSRLSRGRANSGVETVLMERALR